MIARLIISALPERKAEIAKTLASQLSHSSSGSLNHINHPDVLYFPTNSKLGIAEARKIKEHFALKPYCAKGKVVVMEDASVLTVDAQNALLKTLEELPAEGLLLMGTQSDALFLPTVLSRCQIIRFQPRGFKAKVSSDYTADIDILVSSTLAERFVFIEKLKDKEEFLYALSYYFQQNLRLHPWGANLNFLKGLLQAEEWAKQNVNIRAILEYLMLVMPTER